MAVQSQPNPIASGYDTSPLMRFDPIVSYEDVSAQSGATKLTKGATRGLTSKAGGTVAIQGLLDSGQTTVQLNAGIKYDYAIIAFTFGTATDLQALR
jgi:hypothetical protein